MCDDHMNMYGNGVSFTIDRMKPVKLIAYALHSNETWFFMCFNSGQQISNGVDRSFSTGDEAT